MTISRSNIPKQITTGGRKMKKKVIEQVVQLVLVK